MTMWIPDIQETIGPKYRAIALAIAEDMKNGRLQPGDKLPTHRDMADVLGVTVGTVTRGYAEAERRGLVRGHVGRGTYVAGPVEAREHPAAMFQHARAGVIDLGLNTPIYREDPDLAEALATLSKRKDLQRLLQYQPSAGMDEHRRIGVDWVRRYGLETVPEDIVLVSGAQHAITVMFTAMLRPGDTVLVEQYTYPGAKALAEMMGLKLEPVAMDAFGMRPDALEKICRKSNPRALYIMPTIQNPTATTLPENRRAEIARLAKKYDFLIFEDDVHRLLFPDPPPLLAQLAPERTFLVAGTSKCLAGGLRLAFLACPRQAVRRVARSVSATVWMASPLTAEIAGMWIEDGTADRALKLRRAEAAKRQQLAAGIFRDFEFNAHPNGYHLWLELPDPWRPQQLTAEAEKTGISVIPAETFAVGRSTPAHSLRVSLSAAPDRDVLEFGLRTIVDLIAQGPPPPPMIV